MIDKKRFLDLWKVLVEESVCDVQKEQLHNDPSARLKDFLLRNSGKNGICAVSLMDC